MASAEVQGKPMSQRVSTARPVVVLKDSSIQLRWVARAEGRVLLVCKDLAPFRMETSASLTRTLMTNHLALMLHEHAIVHTWGVSGTYRKEDMVVSWRSTGSADTEPGECGCRRND